ncbi:MAG TPA: phosphatidylserine decarboxylase, partial [Clostridiaceae bacterium]|nr:phosphatidylserine decarboxylase [Clostridiaceae bacterium]
VNPVALKKIPEILCKNKREWSIFHSQNFGDMLYIEVGATFVGSILQTYTPNSPVSKGDEKGYFKFGGSTIILIIKSDKVKIDDDILIQTKKGFETKISYGEKIGRKR